MAAVSNVTNFSWMLPRPAIEPRPSRGSLDAVPRELDATQLDADADGLRSMIAADQAMLDADPTGDLALALSQTIAAAQAKLVEVEAEIVKVRGG